MSELFFNVSSFIAGGMVGSIVTVIVMCALIACK